LYGIDPGAVTLISFGDLAALGQKLRGKYTNAQITFVGDGRANMSAAAEATNGRFVELDSAFKNWADIAYWHGPDGVMERLAAKPTVGEVR
jgi:phosphoserine phosphatase